MDRFVWKIANFGFLKGESLISPCFWSSHDNDTNFQLLITQSNSKFLVQVQRTRSYRRILVYCSVSILDPYSSPLINHISKPAFEEKTNVLIFPNDNKYFFNNALVVECCIWQVSTPANQSIVLSCFVLTQLETDTKVVKKIFRGQISEFTADGTCSAFEINEVIWNGRYFKIEINFPKDDQGAVSLSTTSWFGFQAKIKISALDASGKAIEFGNHDALFTSEKRSNKFKLNASKAMFLQHKNKFLPSNTLSLVVSCTFTGHFAIDTIAVESDIFNNSTANNDLAIEEIPEATPDDAETVLNEPEARPESETNAPNTILQSLQDILKDGYLSDFSLKVGDRTFPVHKNILGARSKYFRAMFDSEMKEIQDNCVEMKNVDSETLRRMLQFMYSDRLDEELDSAEACSLYAAADFYALEPLKKSCSEILVDNLCIESVLIILSMADLHRDQKLKSAALDFISLNDKNIIGTKDWIQFEKENANLALETFRELYSRKME